MIKLLYDEKWPDWYKNAIMVHHIRRETKHLKKKAKALSKSIDFKKQSSIKINQFILFSSFNISAYF